jgi:hypothetical protein
MLNCSVFAQKNAMDTVTRVFNEELVATSEAPVFKGYAVRSGNQWQAEIFSESSALVARGSFSSKACKEKEGWFTFYYSNGMRAASGQFHRDKKHGIWRTWYPSGKLRDSLQYRNDKPDGMYHSYFETGGLSGFGKYKDGIEDSTWTWYHPNGIQSSVEEFNRGKLEGQRCMDTMGRKQLKHCELYEEPTTADEKTIWQLVYNGEIPKDESGQPLDGLVTLDIHITENGELKKMEVIPSGNPKLDSAVTKAIAGQIKWNPAYNHNRPISYVRTLTIPFGSKVLRRNNSLRGEHRRNFMDWYSGKVPPGYYWNVDYDGGFR